MCFFGSYLYRGAKEFTEINWQSTKERVEKHVAIKAFKNWKGTLPLYVKF